MRCPSCFYEETKVLESRLSTDARSIRRRRACRRCDYRFTTYEKEETLVIHIKKKDGRIEPYQRDKSLRSIQIACQKRQVKIEELEFLLGKVEAKIQEMGERIVSSRFLGNLVMQELSELDPVAYIRFASVYKDFKDPGEFYAIVKSLS